MKEAAQPHVSAKDESLPLAEPVVLTPEELDAAVGGLLAAGGLSQIVKGGTTTTGLIVGPYSPLRSVLQANTVLSQG